MTITLDIKCEVQAELARQAAARGSGLESYAASLLEDPLHVPRGATRLNQEQLENTFRELGQFSHKIPTLPDDAFTRESPYQNHD